MIVGISLAPSKTLLLIRRGSSVCVWGGGALGKRGTSPSQLAPEFGPDLYYSVKADISRLSEVYGHAVLLLLPRNSYMSR